MRLPSLRKARLQKNLTLGVVAEQVGIHPSYLSKLERGEAEPSALVLAGLEATLGLGSFVTESSPRQQPLFPLPSDSKPDPRNKLNDLSGKDWIQETATVWRQRGLGASHPHTKFERLHPAPFSYQDVARLVRFFTKRGMLVLDPFVGVGSTLKAAAVEGRRGLGVELSPKWAELARLRLDEEVPGHLGQEIWCMDIREALPNIPDSSVDFIVTSPPYWGILNKSADHKIKEVRIKHGLDQKYSDDLRDLANIQEYEMFLAELAGIVDRLAMKLVEGRYCVIVVSDFKHGSKFYRYHSDLYSRIDGGRLELAGVTILHQPQKALYPYGYPFAYVPNIHHQYMLIFKRVVPASTVRRNAFLQKSERLLDQATAPADLAAAVAELRALPFKRGPMAGRHWGHQRHSICSFPSKMKPAVATTLVRLFSDSESTVLDPFCGSGSIVFEGALQGRKTIGCDLSPLATIITSAKIQPPKPEAVFEVIEMMSEEIRRYARKASLEEMEPEIRDFYHEQTAREIVVARTFLLDRTKGFRNDTASLFVAACLAHVLHGNRPYALSRRSHNIIPIPPKGPRTYKSVARAVTEKAKRMLALPLPDDFVSGEVYQCAARSVPLGSESVDVVITSPPFLGTTHFLRQNRIRHWLFGWSYRKQEEMKAEFLEHDRDVTRYRDILKELARVLRPSGAAVFHVGVVKDKNMGDMLAPYFRESGFREVGRVTEDVRSLETHGRVDRGGTHTHEFAVWRKT